MLRLTLPATTLVALSISAASTRAAYAGQPAPEQEVAPPGHPERKASVEPKPAIAPSAATTFDADPIADGAIIAAALGFAVTLDLINSTGEVRPQQIASSFRTSQLLGIDRGAISQHVDPNAGLYSNIGLVGAAAFAAIDPVLSGFREKSVQAGLVDGIIYAESISLAFAMTNMVKMAVRRPRPQAYIDAEAHRGEDYSNADTDSALSFFSGHAAITAAIGATASYLAFSRSPYSARPWVTLVLAASVTTFVSIERVRGGKHFPTDVIAGGIAGAGVGVVVPHLHRSEDIKQRQVWVGFAPVESSHGGSATLSGLF